MFLRLWIISINFAAFVLYGIDKYKAIHHLWRIPEDVLIGLAAAGGGAGAGIGMILFHHKTKHIKFKILIPLFALLWIIGLGMRGRIYDS